MVMVIMNFRNGVASQSQDELIVRTRHIAITIAITNIGNGNGNANYDNDRIFRNGAAGEAGQSPDELIVGLATCDNSLPPQMNTQNNNYQGDDDDDDYHFEDDEQ